MGNAFVKKIEIHNTPEHQRFYFDISNDTEETIYLEELVLLEADSLEELGFEHHNLSVYASGRHKNDMPSVFRLDENSDALSDACSGMTETGDKKEASSQKRIVKSDHLTVLGDEGKYLVITYPEGRSQFFETDLWVDEKGCFEKLICKVSLHVTLQAGCHLKSETIDLLYTSHVREAIDSFALEKAKRYGARSSKRPSVFCTWYYYGLTVTLEDVRTNLSIMQKRHLPFDVFQVDEGWEITLGEWEPNQKFPVTMKDLATEIRQAGYRPGIWTSPFVAHETASIWKKHPEWVLRNSRKEPCLFPMNDTVYYVFDITNPETWDYFRNLYHKLTFEWGYTYHKLDFTRAAVIMEDAVYFDTSRTVVEAYVQAVKAIREGMGEDSYFLMCGGLYDPIIGLVDAQRTGSDVLSMWSSTINKDGKTAPYTMKQSMLRYYMNQWWDNDPDALMVRVNTKMERELRLTYGLLTEDEVKTSVLNQFVGGGLVCSTEPLDRISDDRLSNLMKIMPIVPATCFPMDIMDTSCRFPEKMRVEAKDGIRTYLARINWSDTEEMPISFTLSRDMLPASGKDTDSYVVCDYYGKEYRTHVSVGNHITFPAMKPHAATLIKIEKVEETPIIVASNGHFSMGGEGIRMWCEGGDLKVEYENPFDFALTYEIFVPQTGQIQRIVI